MLLGRPLRGSRERVGVIDDGAGVDVRARRRHRKHAPGWCGYPSRRRGRDRVSEPRRVHDDELDTSTRGWGRITLGRMGGCRVREPRPGRRRVRLRHRRRVPRGRHRTPDRQRRRRHRRARRRDVVESRGVPPRRGASERARAARGHRAGWMHRRSRIPRLLRRLLRRLARPVLPRTSARGRRQLRGATATIRRSGGGETRRQAPGAELRRRGRDTRGVHRTGGRQGDADIAGQGVRGMFPRHGGLLRRARRVHRVHQIGGAETGG